MHKTDNANPMAQISARALYIHIACCTCRCHYCAFATSVLNEEGIQSYVEALCKEIRLFFEQKGGFLDCEQAAPALETVYIGGGTPSLLSAEQLSAILGTVKKYRNIAKNAEVTLEVNPQSADIARLAAYRELGVNRLSVGLQTAQNHLLQQIGRQHDRAAYENCMHEARRVGYQNLSTDILYGLPGQTLQNVQESLQLALDMGSQHLSFYSLILEEGTVFAHKARKGQLHLPDEEVERQMYDCCLLQSQKAGLELYEISNAARLGRESRHNTVYWKGEPYLAFGAGASSYVGGERCSRVGHVRKYIQYLSAAENWQDIQADFWAEREWVDRFSAMQEFFWLGLRNLSGVCARDFQDRFGEEMPDVFRTCLVSCLEDGLLEVKLIGSDPHYVLSRRGLDLANQVFGRFLACERKLRN